jgi:DNA-binding transcriptional MerR regulator
MSKLLQRLDEGKLYYTISEVCRMTGLEPHVLRYWETEFAQMRPRKNRAGNRAYRPREIQYIHYIRHLLHEEKYTLQGAKKKLGEVSFEEVAGQTTLLRVPPAPKPAAVSAPEVAPASVAASADAVPETATAPGIAPALTDDKRKELEAIREGLKGVLNLLNP